MHKWIRSCTVAAAAVLSLAGIPAAIVTIHPSGVANAEKSPERIAAEGTVNGVRKVLLSL